MSYKGFYFIFYTRELCKSYAGVVGLRTAGKKTLNGGARA